MDRLKRKVATTSNGDKAESIKKPRTVRAVRPMVEVARTLRKALTPAEQRLWNILRNRSCGGYRFSRQVPAGHFVLDFYCATARLCVEVDGGIHSDEAVRQYDVDREQVLRDELKIRVFRLTNAEVMDSTPEQLTGRLIQAIQESKKAAPPSRQRPARLLTRKP